MNPTTFQNTQPEAHAEDRSPTEIKGQAEAASVTPPARSITAPSNGHVTEKNGHNGNGHGSLFWQRPLNGASAEGQFRDEDLRWLDPPLPVRGERDGEVRGLLDELTRHLHALPVRAWLARWNYSTKAAAAAHEMDEVDRESRLREADFKTRNASAVATIDAELTAIRERQSTLETELEAAEQLFAESAAKAGLHPDPESTAPPAARLEAALQVATPSLDELAGQHGVAPVTDDHRSGLEKALYAVANFACNFLAPLVCGFMLALCLGTLVGILSLTDLTRGDRTGQLLLAGLLGFVIVSLMGELFGGAVRSYARSQEAAEAAREAPGFRRAALPAVFLMVAVLVFALAEITAEAYGIRELHQQRIASIQRLSGATSQTTAGLAGTSEYTLLPMFVYYLIGTLISGPFLFYKASKAWNGCELRLRDAWLQHLVREWQEVQRLRPEVGEAFQQAQRVESMQSRQRLLAERVKALQEQNDALLKGGLDAATKARRDEARAAAVGEAEQIHRMVEELVDVLEPLPNNPLQSQAVVPQNARRAPFGPRPASNSDYDLAPPRGRA